MRRGGMRFLALALALGVAFLGPPTAGAQQPAALSIQGFSGRAGGSFDGSWNYWASQGQHTTSWREWVQVAVTGAVVHPKLVTFRLRARPELVQGAYLPRVDSVSSNAGGNRLSGDARVDLFSGFQVTGAVYGSLTDAFQRTRYGGWSEGALASWGGEIRDLNPLLPARVSFERSLSDRNTFYPLNGVRIASQEDLTALRYRAQNSKTMLAVEKIDLRNAQSGQSYERTAANLRHTLTWGKGSTLLSGLRYNGRGGDVGARSVAWSEAASLKQARAFWTNLGFSLGRQSGRSGDGSFREGSAGVRYRPSRTLDVGAQGLVRRSRQVGFEQDRMRFGPSGTFTVDLPARLSLTANLSAWYEWRSDQREAGFPVDVIQESQVVGPAGSFRLDQPFVEAGSVVLASSEGNEVFLEGLDYFLLEDGPFLEVHVLPGARLAPGDAVVVDYRYLMQGSIGTRALALASGVAVRRRSWSLYANHSNHRALDDLPVASVAGVRNVERWTTGMMVDARVGRLAATLIGEYGSDRVDGAHASFLTVRSGIAGPLYRQLTSMTSVVHQRRFADGLRGFRRVQVEEALSAPMGPYFTLRGTLSYWMWWDPAGFRRFAGIGGEVLWRRGPVEGRIQYDRAKTWTRADHIEHRLFLEFSRRF